MAIKASSAKEAASLANEAAKLAKELVNNARHEAEVASDAADTIRGWETDLEKHADALNKTADEVAQAHAKMRAGSTTVTAQSSLSKFAEQVHAAQDSVQKIQDAMSRRSTTVEEKISDELKAVPGLKSALAEAREKLAAADYVDKARRSDATPPSPKTLKAVGSAVSKIAALIREVLKWPRVKIWEAAMKNIAEQASITEKCVALAEKLAKRPADKKHVDAAKAAKGVIISNREKASDYYDSAMVAEVLLNVDGFFIAHKPLIYERLEECDQFASKALTNADMLFFAESLPIINGIINVGSTRKELNDATRWVTEHWGGGEAQPRIVLSALLFHYVTTRGAEESVDKSKEQQETWKRIRARVGKLI